MMSLPCFLCLFPTILLILSGDIAMISMVTSQDEIRATDWPVDTNVIYGDNVTFLVTVIEPSSQNQILDWFIEWDNDTQIIRLIPAQVTTIVSTSVRNEFAGRGIYSTSYSMRLEGASKIHTCTLTVNDMTIKDNGYFGLTHQINPDDTHRTLLKQRIRLTVVPVPSATPECTHNIHYSPGKDILTCLWTGDPPAVLTWLEGNQQVADKNHTRFNTIEIDSNPNLQRTFICRAVPVDFPQEDAKTCTIILNPSSTTSATTKDTSTSDNSRTILATLTLATTKDTSTSDDSRTMATTTTLSRTTSTLSTAYSRMATATTTTTASSDSKEPRINTSVITGAVVGFALGVLLLIIIILQVKQILSSRENKQQEGSGSGVVEMTNVQDTGEAPMEATYTEVLDQHEQGNTAVEMANNQDAGDEAEYLEILPDEPETSPQQEYMALEITRDQTQGAERGDGTTYTDLILGTRDDHAYASNIPYIP